MTALKLTSLPLASAAPPVTPRTVASQLRLRMKSPAVAHGYVDGGWWPRSLDLEAELPPLLDVLRSSGYEIHRVLFNPVGWNDAPRRLATAGLITKLGAYATQNIASISLVDSSGWKRLDLVVIPPATDASTAERALVLAAHDVDRHRAPEILPAAVRAGPEPLSHTGCVDDLPSSTWDSDRARARP